MADKVVRVEDAQGFFGELKSSFKGIFSGIIILLLAFPLVFWNEWNSVEVAESLDEGAGLVVSVESGAVDAAQEGKLVHMGGDATTEETLKDATLGVKVMALRLKRSVEMYQWKESKTEKTEGEKTITTYEYDKGWSSTVHDSSRFEESSGHSNPGSMSIENKTIDARTVTMGAFTLAASQVAQLDHWSDYAATEDEAERTGLKVDGGDFYKGVSPTAPAVGDLRISVEVVEPGLVSLVAQQQGSSFAPYTTSNGREISLVTAGTSTAEEMFAQSKKENAIMTWMLRGLAFLMMFGGLRGIFGPLSVIGDRIPLVGGIISGAVGLFCFLLALVIWMFCVALAWLAVRPLLAIGLIVVGVGALVGIFVLAKKMGGADPEPEAEAEVSA